MKTVTIEPQIYTYDIDSGRHVSNITYIRWMEIGRLKLLEAMDLPIHELEKLGVAPALIHTEIDYKKPLYLGDKVRIELNMSELRKISGKMKFTFFRDEKEVVATGEQEAVFFSLSSKRPHRLTKDQMEKFSEYLVEA